MYCTMKNKQHLSQVQDLMPISIKHQNIQNLEETNMEKETFKPTPIWSNIIFLGTLHLISAYFFLVVIVSWPGRVYSYIWGVVIGQMGGFGVTAGAHRLWAHRSYKAKWPLEVILLICHSMSGHNPLYEWVRDHRVHHKFSETDADPHNPKRGFFFAHVGWLLQKKHPEVIRKGKTIDMSDIEQNKLIMLQRKYFILFFLFFNFFIPCSVPVYFWNENCLDTVMGVGILRYCCLLNLTWLVNSAAHKWGQKPFNQSIGPTDHKVIAWITMGEGWHNYHHVFPWDYKAAELGGYMFNSTKQYLDLFAMVGWVYDRKTPSQQLVRAMAEKYGDGTYHVTEEVDVNGNVVEGNEKILN